MGFSPYSNRFWFYAVFLVILCGLNGAYGLGENCTEDANCTTPDSSCQTNVCKCLDTHYKSTNNGNETCVIKVSLGSGCTAVAGEQVCSDTNATCTGTCSCKSGYYDNNGNDPDGTCTPQITLGGDCNNIANECADPNAECSSASNGQCACKSDYYNNNGVCTPKITLGGDCNNIANECADPNAECSSASNGQCACKSDYYNNNGVCTLKIILGGGCNNIANECADPNAECSSASNGQCACKSDYYNNNRVCTPKITLGGDCNNIANECADPNAECSSASNGQCACKSDYYNNNGVCTLKITLGGDCNNIANECADPNAECSSASNGQCACKSDYYNNNGVCTLKITLGGDCNNIANECADPNAECSSASNGQCACKSDYYNNNGVCTLKITLGGDCNNIANECADPNAECSSASNGQCACKSDYYNNNGVCTPKITLGGDCNNIANECADPKAECSSASNGQCACKSDYYNNNGVCTLKIILGGDCTNVPNECADANAECSSASNGQCTCKSDYYNNNGVCTPKIILGGDCTNVPNECADANAECSSASNGQCTCKSDYYNNNGVCTPKIILGGDCTNVPNECADPNAECSSASNGQCTCKSDYYNNNGVCTLRVLLGEPCSAVGNEKVCKDDNSACTNTECTCNSDYYDNNGDSTGGTCESMKTLGSACTVVTGEQVCEDSNADCTGGKCNCKTGYYDDNGNAADGTCKLMKTLGSACTVVTGEQVCEDSNSDCTGGKCNCKTGYYDNNGNSTDGTCQLMKSLGSACSVVTGEQVCEDTNADCTGGKCNCKTNYYDDNGSTADGTCQQMKTLGSACTVVIGEQVCGDSNAECTGGKCNCKTGYYDNNGDTADGTCQQMKNLGSACTVVTGQQVCEDSNADCTGGKCNCKTGYYDNNGNAADGTCQLMKTLGSDCTVVPDEQVCEDTNADCTGGKCNCKTGYYDDNGNSTDGTCQLMKSLGSACSVVTGEQVCEDTNAECTGGKCNCKTNYYDDNGNTADGTCQQMKTLGSDCTVVTGEQVCDDSNADCTGGKCNCKSGYYDDNGDTADGTCQQMKTLGSACTVVTGQQVCEDSNADCTGGKCNCKTGYYDDNGNAADGTCQLMKTLGSDCTVVPDEQVCEDTNADCTGGKCNCKTGYYDDNGNSADGTCQLMLPLGSACTVVTGEQVCEDSNAECTGGKCNCLSGYYDNNGDTADGTCQLMVTLGSDCAVVTGEQVCEDSNADCTGGKCNCLSGYYDDNGSMANGTCQLKLPLGTSCTIADSCADVNAECNSICRCRSGYYDDNNDAANGICESMQDLKVSNIRFETIETTSFTVRWDNPTSINAIEKIDILINGATSGTITNKSNTYPVTGRSPGTVYNVTVTSVDTNSGPGEQKVSDSGSVTTRQILGGDCSASTCSGSDVECSAAPKKCQCKEGFYDTNNDDSGGECKPLSELQVTNIRFTDVTTTSFTVHWNNPNASQVSAIERIEIKVNDRDAKVVTNKGTSYDATGLTPGATNSITVISVDTNSRNTVQKTNTTKQQITKPSKPSTITSIVYNAPNITITWNPGAGVASVFEVTLQHGADYYRTQNVTIASATFSGLTPGVYYNVTIVAISILGADQLRSEPLIDQIRTTPTKPGQPTGVECPTDALDTSLKISWTAPSDPNGIIQFYIVNVYNTSNIIFEKQNTTYLGVTELDVIGLSPETGYHFSVQAVNDAHESIRIGPESAPKKTCQTKAGLATPPQNVKASSNTATGFTIKYEQPVNVNGVLHGYKIVINNGTTCAQEIIVTCQGCTPNVTASQSCSSHNETVSNIEIMQTTIVTNLNPDINYTVTVAAINGAGPGNPFSLNVPTLEDAPKMPTAVQAVSKTSTSVLVTWEIAGPRPGVTTFNISVTEIDNSVERHLKTESVTGFYERSKNITGLEEYWPYKFQVVASTSISENTSQFSEVVYTEQSVPGQVRDFTVAREPVTNYRNVEVSWKIPLPRDRNGQLQSYHLYNNVSGDNTTTIQVVYNDDPIRRNFTVVPETNYQFRVYISNNESTDGIPTIQIYNAPAGAPPMPGNVEDIIPTVAGSHKPTQNSISVDVSTSIFQDDSNGIIQEFGIGVCAVAKCEDSDIPTSIAEANNMKPWSEARTQGYPLFKAISKDSIQIALSTSGRRKRSTDTTVTFILGERSNCSMDTAPKEYCNGPLAPDGSYKVLVFVCTNGGCSSTGFSSAYATQPVPVEPPGPSVGGIAGGVIGAMAGVFVVIIVIIVTQRRRRQKQNTRSVPPEVFVNPEDDEMDTKNIKRHRPIRLSEFPQKVSEKHKDSNLLFAKEYEDIKTLSPKHSTEASEMDENKLKNRYVNILPFDHSRVKLLPTDDDPTTDFINANYLPGYRSEREYIGTQGPIPGTVDDFWRMVWEQNVAIVVMLTLCKEEGRVKCEMYWPSELREPKQYGNLVVETVSCSTVNFYDFRIFKLKLGDVTRTLKHFHFLNWKDFSANVQNDVMIDFIKNVRSHIQPPDMNGPVIVHCSAGVGRTGTYIALDHLIQFIDAHDFEEEIDIFNLVMNLRERRMFMVQTEQQFVFIHDCLKVYLERKMQELQGDHLYDNVNQAFVPDEQESLYQNVEIRQQQTEL